MTLQSSWTSQILNASPSKSSGAFSRMKKILSSPLSKRKSSSAQDLSGSGTLQRTQTLGHNNAHKYFGVPLEVICEREGATVPRLITKTCGYIKQYGLDEEGVLRVNGNARVIESLRWSFDSEADADLKQSGDVMSIAGLLKLFLRELPEGLIPEGATQQCLRAQEVNSKNPAQLRAEVKAILADLPSHNAVVLRYLCTFLVQVAEHKDHNHMDPKALGIVMGPPIFRCSSTLAGIKEHSITNHITTLLIADFKYFFGDKTNTKARRPAPAIPNTPGGGSSLVITNHVHSNASQNSEGDDQSHRSEPSDLATTQASDEDIMTLETDRSDFNHSYMETPRHNINPEVIEAAISSAVCQHLFGDSDDSNSDTDTPVPAPRKRRQLQNNQRREEAERKQPSVQERVKVLETSPTKSQTLLGNLHRGSGDSLEKTNRAQAFEMFEKQGILIGLAPGDFRSKVLKADSSRVSSKELSATMGSDKTPQEPDTRQSREPATRRKDSETLHKTTEVFISASQDSTPRALPRKSKERPVDERDSSGLNGVSRVEDPLTMFKRPQGPKNRRTPTRQSLRPSDTEVIQTFMEQRTHPQGIDPPSSEEEGSSQEDRVPGAGQNRGKEQQTIVHHKDKYSDEILQSRETQGHRDQERLQNKDKQGHDQEKTLQNKDKQAQDKEKTLQNKDKQEQDKEKTLQNKEKQEQDKEKTIPSKEKQDDKEKTQTYKDLYAQNKESARSRVLQLTKDADHRETGVNKEVAEGKKEKTESTMSEQDKGAIVQNRSESRKQKAAAQTKVGPTQNMGSAVMDVSPRPDSVHRHGLDRQIPPLDLSILHQHGDGQESILVHPESNLWTTSNGPMLSPRSKEEQCAVSDSDEAPNPPANHLIIHRSIQDRYSQQTKSFTKKIQTLKRKLKHFEDKFEVEHGYRPSQTDKAADPDIKKVIQDLAKTRKDLRKLKEEQDSEAASRDVDENPRETPPSMEQTRDMLLARLDDKRKLNGRPSELTHLSYEQIQEEKLAIQKALLHYESIHGRPSSHREKELMRPLYDRYRIVKKLLAKAEKEEQRSSALNPVPENGASDSIGAKPRSSRRNIRTIQTHPVDKTQEFDTLTVTQSSLNTKLLSNTKENKAKNLHEMAYVELLEEQRHIKMEKKNLRKLLHEFEEEFEEKYSRRADKGDRGVYEEDFSRYKEIKQRLKLVDALLYKHQDLDI